MAEWNKCPKCGNIIQSREDFCPKCGAELTIACQKCGEKWRVYHNYKFCRKCGARIGK